MAIEIIISEIKRFLSTSEPEVLCITGDWGIGKTFLWKRCLSEAQEEKKVKLAKYAYVSLFGRNSLEDVRGSIVENTVNSDLKNIIPTIDSYATACSTLSSVANKASKIFKYLPSTNAYAVSANRILFLNLKEQIICFDDFERLGKGLDPNIIMGLIADLKEQKKCKIVLLLNREALGKDHESYFKTQIEKIADVILEFIPTPNESADIGIENFTKMSTFIRDKICLLNIVNIRLIKKIEYFCSRTFKILQNFDDRIIKQAITAIVLGTYAKFQPKDAPSIDFIRNYNTYTDLFDKNKIQDEKTKAYHKILSRYEFDKADEFDMAIFSAIESGFFDEKAIKIEATKLTKLLDIGDKYEAIQCAFDSFYRSFDENYEEKIDTIHALIQKNVSWISLETLDAAVQLLKEVGREQHAKEIISYYITNKAAEPEFWNLDSISRRNLVRDPDILTAFSEKYNKISPTCEPISALIDIANGSYKQEELKLLAGLPVDEYVQLFKGLHGSELDTAIRGGLYFNNVGNSSEYMIQLTEKVETALRQIAAENKINALRVRRYGISSIE